VGRYSSITSILCTLVLRVIDGAGSDFISFHNAEMFSLRWSERDRASDGGGDAVRKIWINDNGEWKWEREWEDWLRVER
jgi:hypothetical protein